MQDNYRSFNMRTIRTEILSVSDQIAEHKNLLEEAETKIAVPIDRWVLFVSALAGIPFGVLISLFTRSVLLGVGVFGVVTLALFFASKMNYIQKRIRKMERYEIPRKQISQSKVAIKELTEKAHTYQEHLEPTRFPGLLEKWTALVDGHCLGATSRLVPSPITR